MQTDYRQDYASDLSDYQLQSEHAPSLFQRVQCWVWWLLVARALNVDPNCEPQLASSSPAATPPPELQPSLAG